MKQKYTISIADIEMSILSEGSADEVDAIVAKVDRKVREICRQSQRISKTEAAMLCALEFCAECDTAERNMTRSDEEYEALKSENAKLAEACEKLTEGYSKLDEKLNAQKEKYEAALAAQKEKYETALSTQKEKYEGRIEIMKEKYEARINSLRARAEEIKKSPASVQQKPVADAADDATAAEAAAPGKVAVAENPAAAVTTVGSPAAEATASADTSAAEMPAAAAADISAVAEQTAAAPAEQATDSKKEPRSKAKSKVGNMFELLTFNDV